MRVIDGPVAVLSGNHPYLKQFPLVIEAAPGGGWRITWRSFDQVKQEAFFECPGKASKHCAWMNENRHIVDGDGLGGSLDECDVMWQSDAVVKELDDALARVRIHERLSRGSKP